MSCGRHGFLLFLFWCVMSSDVAWCVSQTAIGNKNKCTLPCRETESEAVRKEQLSQQNDATGSGGLGRKRKWRAVQSVGTFFCIDVSSSWGVTLEMRQARGHAAALGVPQWHQVMLLIRFEFQRLENKQHLMMMMVSVVSEKNQLLAASGGPSAGTLSDDVSNCSTITTFLRIKCFHFPERVKRWRRHVMSVWCEMLAS